MITLKPRKTIYRGIEMRSRLEARVAAEFEKAGARWQYEPQCYADAEGQYLPDFLLSAVHFRLDRECLPWWGEWIGPLIVEVKPYLGDVDSRVNLVRPVWSSVWTPVVVLAPGRRPNGLLLVPTHKDLPCGAPPAPCDVTTCTQPRLITWLRVNVGRCRCGHVYVVDAEAAAHQFGSICWPAYWHDHGLTPVWPPL